MNLLTFLTDKDGVTAKDFLLFFSFVPFLIAWLAAFGMDIAGVEVSETYFLLLDQMKPIVMTIVTGVFAVQGVQYGADAFSRRKEEKQNDYEGRV